jgi:hypothetical protein
MTIISRTLNRWRGHSGGSVERVPSRGAAASEPSPPPLARKPDEPFDTYEPRVPSPQNAIDAIPGWNSILPAEYGLVAGKRVHFATNA